MANQSEADNDLCELCWHNIQAELLEGAGWQDAARNFARLPEHAKSMVRDEVWFRSRHAAGLCVRFVTNSPTIHADWELVFDTLAMPRMPATSVSGLDLYVRQAEGYSWVGVTQPDKTKDKQAIVRNGLSTESKEFLLYLPLYNSVKHLGIGVAAGSEFHFLPPRNVGSGEGIVFYGTSITQGGCASRSGMNHVARLGRSLDIPVINLGIGGNAKMETELAELLGELDPALYVIDCRANMDAELIKQRYVPFVKKLRELRPNTPLLLSKGTKLCDLPYIESRRQHFETSIEATDIAWQILRKDGVQGLFYLSDEGQLGDDNLATVDGTHPSDLGFMLQSAVMLPAITAALAYRQNQES